MANAHFGPATARYYLPLLALAPTRLLRLSATLVSALLPQSSLCLYLYLYLSARVRLKGVHDLATLADMC